MECTGLCKCMQTKIFMHIRHFEWGYGCFHMFKGNWRSFHIHVAAHIFMTPAPPKCIRPNACWFKTTSRLLLQHHAWYPSYKWLWQDLSSWQVTFPSFIAFWWCDFDKDMCKDKTFWTILGLSQSNRPAPCPFPKTIVLISFGHY